MRRAECREQRSEGRDRAPGVAAGVILVVAGLWAASRTASSGDLWVALGCGRYILAHGVGSTDPFSFTSIPGHWINQNWLSHVLFTWIHDLAGLAGLGLWKALVCVAIVLLVASAARRLGAGTVAKVAAGLAVAWVGRPFFDIRPNLHTILLAALLVRWIAGIESRSWRSSIPILILFIVWANLHGGFLFGVLAIAAGIAATVIQTLLRKERIESAWLIFLPPLALAAAAVSPYGIRNLTHPYEVSAGPDAAHWRGVIEWRPPFGPGAWDDPGVRLFWILTGLVAAIVAAAAARGRITDRIRPALPVAAVALLGLVLSLTSRRFVPLYAVAVVPVAAALAARAADEIRLRSAAWPIAAVAVTLVAGWDIATRLFVGDAIWPASMGWSKRLVRADEVPADAVTFVRTSSLGGRLLTDWAWGGYLLYRAPFERKEPRYRIFIDGRAQAAYPAEISRDWVALGYAASRGDREIVAAFLDHYAIDICVLDRRGPGLAEIVPELDGWVGIYGDDRAVVATRRDRTAQIDAGTFPDGAVRSASASLRLRTQGEMSIATLSEAFGHALLSIQARPTTTGVTEMVRVALAAPDAIAAEFRADATRRCDRLLAHPIPAATAYESLVIEANTAQSRSVLARAVGDEEAIRIHRARAKEAAAKADALLRRYLR